VSPTVLVPLAERGGLITEIGRWVLDNACSDRHRWQREHAHDDLSISVNVSVHQLMSPDLRHHRRGGSVGRTRSR